MGILYLKFELFDWIFRKYRLWKKRRHQKIVEEIARCEKKTVDSVVEYLGQIPDDCIIRESDG